MLSTTHRRVQRGTSINELMVALTIGAIVVAAALIWYAQQTREARRTLLQLRLEQDLRAAGDALATEARRSGFVAGVDTTSLAGSSSPSHDARMPAPLDRLGVRLRNGVLQTFQGAGGWQPLTDPDSLLLTRLEAVESTQHLELPLGAAVAASLPAAALGRPAAACPRLQRLSIELTVEARSARDASLRSRWQRRVLLRNDRIVAGTCAGAGGAG